MLLYDVYKKNSNNRIFHVEYPRGLDLIKYISFIISMEHDLNLNTFIIENCLDI